MASDYEPSPWEPIADHVAGYIDSDGEASVQAVTERDIPLVICEPR